MSKLSRLRSLVALISLSAVVIPATVVGQGPDGPTGQVQQPLINGAPVDLAIAEEYGLVNITALQPGGASVGLCSGSLLTNDWVLTAAHCVPAFNLANPGTVTVNANWKTVQSRTGVQIVSFGNAPNWAPWDIALIRLNTRLSVFDDTDNFKQIIWGDGPYTNLNQYPIEMFGSGIYQFAQNTGGVATPSLNDRQLRYGKAVIRRVDGQRYWYPNETGQIVAGGDSGGPSFVMLRVGRALTGVHSLCSTQCLSGQNCSGGSWTWVSAATECGDAPIQPLWSQISQIIQATRSPEPPTPPGQFVGTFGTTPTNYRAIFLYAIPDNGDLLWYRQDANATSWAGPKRVGNGWQNYPNVIPAGGDAFYALGADGSLKWYRHDGFNDGSFAWTGPQEVGHGWNFPKIFSGGEGIVYAIRADGHLLWYHHGGYLDGGGINTWTGPLDVGAGWSQFKDVFSMGQGIIYAVLPDGTLQWYRHDGYATGAAAWTGPKTVGSGWQNFKAIIPGGDGIILAVTSDGKLLYYRHKNFAVGVSTLVGPLRGKPEWDGPTEIGHGWQGFRKIFALLPSTAEQPR